MKLLLYGVFTAQSRRRIGRSVGVLVCDLMQSWLREYGSRNGVSKVCFTHRYYDEDCHLLQAVPDCSSYLPVAIYDTSHQMSHQTSSSNHLLLSRHSPHTDGQGSPRSALRRVRRGCSSTGQRTPIVWLSSKQHSLLLRHWPCSHSLFTLLMFLYPSDTTTTTTIYYDRHVGGIVYGCQQ